MHTTHKNIITKYLLPSHMFKYSIIAHTQSSNQIYIWKRVTTKPVTCRDWNSINFNYMCTRSIRFRSSADRLMCVSSLECHLPHKHIKEMLSTTILIFIDLSSITGTIWLHYVKIICYPYIRPGAHVENHLYDWSLFWKTQEWRHLTSLDLVDCMAGTKRLQNCVTCSNSLIKN